MAPEVPVNFKGTKTTQDKRHSLSVQTVPAAALLCDVYFSPNLFIEMYIKCIHIRFQSAEISQTYPLDSDPEHF